MANMSFTPPAAPQVEARLREAAGDLAAGRTAEAVAACEAVLASAPAQPTALHLLGVALTRLERAAEAVAILERAVAAAPRSAACHVALGNALRKAGDPRRATGSYRQALALEPGHAAAAFNLALALDECGEPQAALAALAGVARANPLDFEAAQLLVDRLAKSVRQGGVVEGPQEASHGAQGAGTGLVTVGFCSVQPAREARARESIARALLPAESEFIVVRDARSLAEGFNRILDAARGDVVILCHDDIEVLSPRLDLRIAEGLAQADIVGVAGSDRAGGPAVLWTGHPHVHGWVTYPRAGEVEVAPLSFRSGLLGGMQALDGVFMAMKTATARQVRFDAATFDGFHFYDLDFSYRAHSAGLRLAVSTDILLLHASEGRFEDDWKRQAQRFLDKFPQLRAPQGKPHWYGARLPGPDHARAFYAKLRELCH
jgi:tetratricopeptide (TPR) repeat protein